MRTYLSIILFLLLSATAQADDHRFISLSFENDVFFKDDGLYSNGLFLTWGYNQVDALNDKILPSWITYLAQQTHITFANNKQYAIGYSLGQALQTAIDIEVETLVEEDAPYVGLLAWQVKLLAYDQFMNDEVGLILGAVGPVAGGEFVQSFVHGLTGAKQPQGWDQQINNEFVFRVQARRTWRLYETHLFNAEFDFLTGVDGGLGNLRSDVAAGIGFRVGQKLRDNFISSTVFPVQKFNGLNYTLHGWYLFFNVSTVYVLNDIFINGNTFHDSHSVELIHLQVAYSAGIMVNIYDFSVLYTLLHISDEYEGQAEASRFGSIALTYHF
ncbi:lipid A deacylase LpxR family protein [Psychromonas hadalis]|uniref:lipid A deacylase LpxR family protein n=1 Tax=Psychromonas hadalis TaxID=211669 RepID=UPI0003B59C84|nr:lipid A deacylase LpxR family protein [Psychromonas hadalis]